jgi:HEAT repeat protein
VELAKIIVSAFAILAFSKAATEAASPTTPPHIYYLIHTNRIDTALDHYQDYVDQHGRHDTEFLQQLGLSVLQQGAKSRDPDINLMTLFGAGIAMNERALDILIRGIEGPNPQLQFIAMHFLARYNDDDADNCLLQALRSNNLLIRFEAARQIALKKLPKATHLIESLMGKVDSNLLPLFPQLFAAIGDSDSSKILRRLLSHPDEDVRIEAVLSAAKAGRDDMLPKIKILAMQHSYPLQEACAYAFGCFKDETTIPILEGLSKSTVSQVQLAALQALYKFDRQSAADGIKSMAAEGDLYAINALGEIPGSQELLYSLSQCNHSQVRLNATLGLLKLHDSRCQPLLKSILIRDQRDLAFVKMSSQGKALSYWKTQPSTRQNFEDFSIDLELSQHFRESVLEQLIELPKEIFYTAVEAVFDSQ